MHPDRSWLVVVRHALLALVLASPAAALAGCEGVACTDFADKLCSAACDCSGDDTCRLEHQDGSVETYADYDDCYASYESLVCDGSPRIHIVDCDMALDDPQCTPEGTLSLDPSCQ
jgi:hypothetical protein